METAVEVLYLLGFRRSVAIFVFCTPYQPSSNGHILASTRPIDPIFSAFFISIYLFSVLVLFAMETVVEVLYLLGFWLFCWHFCVLYPNRPPNGHILASTRPIDPIFSFFISIYLFWSYSRWKRLWKCFVCLVFCCSVATCVFCILIDH
jgi:hypothetical protein